jgi:HEAT repeat protein
VQAGIVKAISANELDQSLEALLRLIRLETDATSPDVQRAYGIALRRLLTTEHLRRFAPLAFDEVYHEDIVKVMRRAGKAGTKMLLDLLIEAPSQAERRAYLRALRQMEEGSDVIASLLGHHEWFVVRNAADLVGELKLVEAVPALSRVAQHTEARVRRAVGLALARIGTPETALSLRKLVTDADPEVRLAVVKELGGRGMSGLAMPIVSAAGAEQDPEVLSEYYRALGRIGTPDAVQALVKAAQESPGLLSRKPQGPRLAAIEALGTAGGPSAVAVLKELMESRSGDVRATAAGALERATASASGA